MATSATRFLAVICCSGLCTTAIGDADGHVDVMDMGEGELIEVVRAAGVEPHRMSWPGQSEESRRAKLVQLLLDAPQAVGSFRCCDVVRRPGALQLQSLWRIPNAAVS